MGTTHRTRREQKNREMLYRWSILSIAYHCLIFSYSFAFVVERFRLNSFRYNPKCVKHDALSLHIVMSSIGPRGWNGGSGGNQMRGGSYRPSGRPSKYGGYGGGGGGRYGRPQMDPAAKLRFKKTIKIDPEYKTKIEDMKLSEKTLKVLKDKGFQEMTPVQSQSFDYVYSGDDVVARSRTGTGKTFAFGLPLIEKIVSSGLNERRGADGLPLILVLEPTRELALQVAQELASVCSVHRMRVQAIFGGSSYSVQERAIRSGVVSNFMYPLSIVTSYFPLHEFGPLKICLSSLYS